MFRSLKKEYNLKGSGKDLFDASVYKDDVSTSSFHDMVNEMSRLTKDAKPTEFHHMLATIASEDRLLRLYSQNVDGIDTGLEPLRTSIPLAKGADGKWPRTVQVHGGLDKMVCSKCHDLADLEPTLFDGPVPPTCTRCVEVNDIRVGVEGKRSHGIGRMRPRMVLYNEHNPDDEAIGAVTKDDLRKRPDAVIVVGTTLKVPGVRRIVREMCATVRDRRGGVAIWINSDPPPIAKDLEDCWDIIVQGPCDKVAKHAAMRRWNAPPNSDDYLDVSDGEAKKTAEKSLHVQLPLKQQQSAHAPKVARKSDFHRNNSFIPPSPGESTPQKPRDHGPEYSPIRTPIPLVVRSIEPFGQDGDSSILVSTDISTINAHGLLTPSKSESTRSSPAKKAMPALPKFPNLSGKSKELLKKRQPAKGTKATAPAKSKKKSSVAKLPATKVVKTTKASTKPTTKTKGRPKQTSTLSLTVTKASVGAAKFNKKEKDCQDEGQKSPSKLRQVTNAQTERLRPVSPNARMSIASITD